MKLPMQLQSVWVQPRISHQLARTCMDVMKSIFEMEPLPGDEQELREFFFEFAKRYHQRKRDGQKGSA